MDMIDQIGGWSSINSVGSFYGHGFNLEIITKYVLRSCGNPPIFNGAQP